jgi:beta-glucosidase
MKNRTLKTRLISFAGIAIIFLLSANKTGEPVEQVIKSPIYLNTAYSFAERAADLVSRLTLEEKESLIGNSMPAVPRLGINSFNVWSEGYGRL